MRGVVAKRRERSPPLAESRLKISENRRVLLARDDDIRLVNEVRLGTRLAWYRLPIARDGKIRASDTMHLLFKTLCLLFKECL